MLILHPKARIYNLHLILPYLKVLANHHVYLMGAITKLPNIEIMSLSIFTEGRTFGPCVFHLLRISTSIRELSLKFLLGGNVKAQTACSSGCICGHPQNWETEDISLNHLQSVRISHLEGVEHVFTFVKRLLRWAPILKTVTVNFDPSASVTEEMCKKLLSLSSLETCLKIYLFRDGDMVMYAPEE